MPTETSFSGTTTLTTPVSVTYGDEPTEYNLEITQGNTKASITSPTATSSTLYGDVTITYTLENDESDTSSIQPQYSTDSGTTYNDMTDAGGSSEGKTALSSSASGISHTFIWDSATDLGLDHRGNVRVRIVAYDHNNHKGDWIYSSTVDVAIDNAPEAPTLVSPTDSYFRKDETPQFVFTIPNPRAGNSKLHFKLQIDTETSFNSDNLIEFESRLDQTGWEYNDGSNWVSIPHNGVDVPSDPTLIGNQARLTVQTDDKISQDEWVWRVVAGGCA